LFDVSQKGDVGVVKILLAYGANVNDKNNVSVLAILRIISSYKIIVIVFMIRMDIQHWILLLPMVVSKLSRYC